MSINFNNIIPSTIYINGNCYTPQQLGFPMDLEPMSEEYSNTHTITQNGNYIVLSDTDRYLTQLDLSVNVPGGLMGQEKEVTIPVDTTSLTTVTPDSEYNALTNVRVFISDIQQNVYDTISINMQNIDSTTYTNYLNPDPTRPKVLEIGYDFLNGKLRLGAFHFRDDFHGDTKPGYIYIDADSPTIDLALQYNTYVDRYILSRNYDPVFRGTLILNY